MAEAEKPKEIIDSNFAEKAVRDADVSEIVAKYDKESVFRVLPEFSLSSGISWAFLIKLIAICFSLFQLYTAAFGTFPTQIQRVTHLGFAMCLAFLLYPATQKKPSGKMGQGAVFLAVLAALVSAYAIISFLLFRFYNTTFGIFTIQTVMQLGVVLLLAFLVFSATREKPRDKMAWEDILLAALAVWVCAYVVIEYETIMFLAGRPREWDLFHSALVIILVLEITRRVVGLPLSLIAIAFIAYAHWGNHIPGILGHRGAPWRRILHHLYMTTEGILGVPIGVSTEFVFLFILFGAFLQKTGLGKFFIDIALAVAGHHTGGPAKVVVLSSCLLGTITGSSIANAVTTGPFTIPLMKSTGYKSEFAAAVEAAASTGGQILPPIMGAAAFIMSQFINVPYLQIAKAATIPALLYFFAVFFMVHLEAKRLNLKGLPKEQLPSFIKTMLNGGHLLIPIFAIVYMLLQGFTPSMSALYGIITTVAVSIAHSVVFLLIKIGKEGNFVQNISNFVTEWCKIIIESLETGARSAVGVAVACACAGIIIGVVTLTGVGLTLSTAIVRFAGDRLFLTLVLTMVASILLGLGLPTTAKYIILSTMAAPAIAGFEVDGVQISLLAAHMFILYFGVFADITPPVALVTYATAGIAKANATKASLIALKVAVAGFIVPFVFVYSPELLLINATWYNVLIAVITTIAGICTLGFAASGYWLRNLNVLERLFLFAGAVALIFPGWESDLAGAGVLIIVYLLQKMMPEKNLLPS